MAAPMADCVTARRAVNREPEAENGGGGEEQEVEEGRGGGGRRSTDPSLFS